MTDTTLPVLVRVPAAPSPQVNRWTGQGSAEVAAVTGEGTMVGESMSGRHEVGAPEGVLTEERPGTTHPDGLVDEQRRRRRAAEAAADAAEAVAAEAAGRASAAIAAAARAAADAEAAADLAARAAAAAAAAAAAERDAVERAHAIGAANETTIALTPLPERTPPASPFPSRPAGPAAVPDQALPPDEAAVARAATMTISLAPLSDAPVTDTARETGGRAARRRAQEAAAAVALEANRDPDTRVFTVDPEPRPAVDEPASRRRRSEPDGGSGSPRTGLLARLRGRPGGRTVLVAAAVVGVVLVAAVVAGLTSSSRGASNAAVTAPAPPTAATAAPTSAAGEPDAAVDPTSTRAVAYLKALRAAGVPTSDSGQSETEAAQVICQQLAKGAQAADLVRALPAVLPTVNSKQARSVVSTAQKVYCSP